MIILRYHNNVNNFKFSSNVCPTCLVCLGLYENLWKNCSCQPINLNKKCKKGIEYKLDSFIINILLEQVPLLNKLNMIINLLAGLKMTEFFPKFFKNKIFIFDKKRKIIRKK